MVIVVKSHQVSMISQKCSRCPKKYFIAKFDYILCRDLSSNGIAFLPVRAFANFKNLEEL